MARPEEKAQAMMSKWVKMKEDENITHQSLAKQKRPFLASHCEHLHDAEYWRRQILREISAGISKIQNPGLGEHAIRDLNDDINKRMREKYHWNRRIKELGGPDYNVLEKKQQRMEGDIQSESSSSGLMGSGGYRYFGAAKDLPGVRELFAKQQEKQAARKRRTGDVYKQITPDYFGWRDEEDGVLLELEREATERTKQALGQARQENKRLKMEQGIVVEDEKDNDESSDEDDEGGFIGHYAEVPTQELVAQAILEQKKKALLQRFSLA